MRELNSLETRREKRFTAANLFLCAVVLLLFSPFAGITSMFGMTGDTAIQIKIGLDDIAHGTLITDEIYSWHENLVFTAHESGWYLLLGFMYKMIGLWGVIAVGMLFNYATGFTALSYSKDKAHPFITALVIAITPMLNGYPDYNVRPSVTSIFLVTLLMAVFMTDRKPLTRVIVFSVSCFLLGWFQGGILPLYFVVYAVFIVIELLYKKLRDAGSLSIGLASGFILSLLNPMGIRNWLFGLKQSGATDIWVLVDEWKPMSFSILQAVLILLVLIGFMTGEGIRKFEKKTVTKLALLCMFFILTCVYKRFVSYFSVAFLMFAPEQYESLLKWLGSEVLKLKKMPSLTLSDFFYKVLSGCIVLMMAALAVIQVNAYLPTGTFADIEKMAAYDPQAVEFIKEQGYEKIFNSFDTGSWLAFHDVKVHIDNRIDPFMSEFSGEDHIRGQMSMDTLSDLDAFRARYDNDAFLINYPNPDLLYEIDTYAAGRYRLVYDNTVDSSIEGVGSMRWIIIECI